MAFNIKLDPTTKSATRRWLINCPTQGHSHSFLGSSLAFPACVAGGVMKLLEPAGGKRLSSSSKRFERQNATCLRGRLGLAANSGAGMLDAGARSGIFFSGFIFPCLMWCCIGRGLVHVRICLRWLYVLRFLRKEGSIRLRSLQCWLAWNIQRTAGEGQEHVEVQRRLKIYSSFDSSSRCWVNGQHGNCSWKKKNISESLAGFVIDFPSCSPHMTNFSEIGDGILFSQLRRRVSL